MNGVPRAGPGSRRERRRRRGSQPPRADGAKGRSQSPDGPSPGAGTGLDPQPPEPQGEMWLNAPHPRLWRLVMAAQADPCPGGPGRPARRRAVRPETYRQHPRAGQARPGRRGAGTARPPGPLPLRSPAARVGKGPGVARSTLPADARGRTGHLIPSAAPQVGCHLPPSPQCGRSRPERHLVQRARPHVAAGQGLVVREDDGVVLGVGLVAALTDPAAVARERAVEAPGTDGEAGHRPRGLLGKGRPRPLRKAGPSPPPPRASLGLGQRWLSTSPGPRQPPALVSSASSPASPPNARCPPPAAGLGSDAWPPVPGPRRPQLPAPGPVPLSPPAGLSPAAPQGHLLPRSVLTASCANRARADGL